MFNDFETKLTSESNWEQKYIHIFKGIFIASTENDYKKGNKIHLNEENEFTIEEKKTDDVNFYVLNIKSKKYHIMIRADNRISLEYVIFHSNMKDDKDIGRPLTFYPHLSNIESALEEKKIHGTNFRGFIHLMILALIASHLRLMWENYMKYGILLAPKNMIFFFFEHENVVFLSASFIIVFIVVGLTFVLEKISSKSKSQTIYLLLHTINLIFLLLAPLLFHRYNMINPLTGIIVLTLITVVFLKLFSYIHFWNDVKMFIAKRKQLIKEDEKSLELQGNVYLQIGEVITNYPKNLLLKDLLKFLILPILCYQYKYPTTHRIRKSMVFKFALQFVLGFFMFVFITWQYVLPTVRNSIKFIRNEDYMNMVERILKLAIPCLYNWIIMFYCFFHSWLNLLAELTQFGDRTFYKDWWNSLYLDEYWRTWNLPTHYWLIRHIYNPLRRRKIDKVTAGGIVFFVSAIFHEYVISGALGYTNYWAFIAMFANFPFSILQELIKRSKFINNQSQMLNVMFWINFCFLGQPLCIMLYCYNYYKRYEFPQN